MGIKLNFITDDNSPTTLASEERSRHEWAFLPNNIHDLPLPLVDVDVAVGDDLVFKFVVEVLVSGTCIDTAYVCMWRSELFKKNYFVRNYIYYIGFCLHLQARIQSGQLN